MKNIMHKSKWFPDYLADTILDIDPNTLQTLGITHVVFDLDNTLVHHGKNDLTNQYQEHIKLLAANGLSILLGTNTKRNVNDLAVTLQAIAVQPAGLSYKPFRSFYKRIIATAGTTPDHIAMVGDHIINDVYGANRTGLTTIIVRALHNRPSYIYRRYLQTVMRRT